MEPRYYNITILGWVKFLIVSRIDLQVFQICKHLGRTVKKDEKKMKSQISIEMEF